MNSRPMFDIIATNAPSDPFGLSLVLLLSQDAAGTMQACTAHNADDSWDIQLGCSISGRTLSS